jgi:hypothetical protein
LKVIAALTDSTLDRLLQPVGSTHPTGFAITVASSQTCRSGRDSLSHDAAGLILLGWGKWQSVSDGGNLHPHLAV